MQPQDKASGRGSDIEPPDPFGASPLAFDQFKLTRHDIAQLRFGLLAALGRQAGDLDFDLGDPACRFGPRGGQFTFAAFRLGQFAFDGRDTRGLSQASF